MVDAWSNGQTPPELPDQLDEQQREKILAWFAEHPDGGYKAALAHVGIHATKRQAKQLLHGDDELREARFKGLGLDEVSLFRKLGEITADAQHKDRLRAITFGLNAIHRWHENQAIEHTGADGGPMEVTNPDVAAAIERFTASVVQLASRDRPELPSGGSTG